MAGRVFMLGNNVTMPIQLYQERQAPRVTFRVKVTLGTTSGNAQRVEEGLGKRVDTILHWVRDMVHKR